MSTPKRFFQSTQNLFRPIWRLGRAIVRGFMNRLLRVLVRLLGHPSRLTQAGFVLPTVVMVMLVVTLLTTAIVFRSFDRAKNASNFRVNQAVLNAATPGIDRAKAKLEALFADPLLPQGTPSEISIGNVLERDKYILGDEDRIQVEFDVDGSGQIDPPEETLTTAWRFPVDTDNNGRYDSISLYGIYFRNPETNNRERTPLDARTTPMATGLANNPACEQAVGTSASLVGTRGWYKVGGDLKKAFFVYVATVPITDKDDNDFTRPSIGQEEDYENYTGGNRGFSALEYQQDFARIPLSNNAILYDGDIEMASGPDFFINGRIFTNGNLLVRESGVGETIFRQVSSPESCFYEADKSKIVVGGNYVYGTTNKSDQGEIETHLFREGEKPNTGAEITDKNASVSEVSTNVAYNNKAYNQRIDYLVDEAFKKNSDPEEVQERAKALIDDPTNPLPEERARRQALEIYFRNRTRRVPYVEVASTDDKDVALADAALIGSGDDLRPPNKWIFPFVTDETGKSNLSSNTGLTLNDQGATLLPAATEFDVQEERVNESFIGDRMLIGNNLPALWYIDPDGDGEGEFVGSDALQPIEGTKWNEPAGSQPRQRKTRVRQLDELDTIERDGFWESASAEQPKNKLDGVGGLRIVTGAGAYLPFDDDIRNAANPSHVVWPDTMPVIDPYAVGLPVPPTPPSWLPSSLIDNSVSPVKFPVDENDQSRPYLKMRASAVYHYTYKEGKEPIACVDNYYDPTNKDTAERATDGNMVNENGKVYGPAPQASKPLLEYQANLVYPNGRPVNQLLKDALAADDPTLAQQAAIDSTSCALSIYNTIGGTLSGAGALGAVPSGYTLPDGTIKETAFLDARQVKLIDKDYNPGNEATGGDAKAITTDPVEPLDNSNPQPVPAPGYETLTGHYDLPIEQRYPLEVRATVIDLDKLRQETAAGGLSKEYMLPNSGIIYATRDDALADMSNPDGESISATDFRLDPTRRPNGIMLINGEKLWRTEDFREEEKGLILTSNLPVYVKGTFNKHTEQEFVNNDTTTNAEFYGRSQVNPNFACRNEDPRIPCPTGDEWRNATILSDAVTVLSQDFREGVRVEGDYDLRNNQIDNVASPDTSNDSSLNAPTFEVNQAQTPNVAPSGTPLPQKTIEELRLDQGFWNNNFVTNGLSSKGYTFAAGSIRTGFPSSAVTPTDVFYSTTNESDVINSSYFNNFVTPIQRRVEAPEYVMEICRKLPVSECGVGDWVAGYDLNRDGVLDNTEAKIKASDLAKVLADNGKNAFSDVDFNLADLGAGTTARPPFRDSDRRFARRIAFLRDTDGIDESDFDPSLIYLPQVVNSDELVLQIITGGGLPNLSSLGIVAAPVPIGIDATTGALDYYPYRNTLDITVTGGSNRSFPLNGSRIPRTQPNSLLYRTTNRFVPTIEEYGAQHPLWLKDGPEWLKTDPTPLSSEKRQAQPLLVPALQLQYPTAEDANEVKAKNENNANAETNWIPRVTSDEAKTTITDMIVATGDNPSRPPFDYDDNGSTLNHQGDFSGGVPNLVRFLENWDDATSEIQGSLIQIKRSNYATAPYFTLPETEENNNVRNRLNSASTSAELGMPQIYTTQNAFGKVPSFAPPNRQWGFDVGILSQLPDLFSQQFTLPDTDEPNEFYREVSRDDEWVNVLLCGQVLDDNGDTRDYAINEDQRRSCT